MAGNLLLILLWIISFPLGLILGAYLGMAVIRWLWSRNDDNTIGGPETTTSILSGRK